MYHFSQNGKYVLNKEKVKILRICTHMRAYTPVKHHNYIKNMKSQTGDSCQKNP